jgi:ABC-type transport system involved in multi-copper enzyme maturation permease subunit
MRYVKAELIKIGKTHFLWVLGASYILIFLLFFSQYTINKDANVIEPMLKNPVNLYSFFLLIFSLFFNIVFAVAIGSFLGGKEYSYNTIQISIQSSGRYKGTFAGFLTLFIITSIFIIVIVLLGTTLGLVHTRNLSNFNLRELINRFVVALVSTYLIGLLAMTVSKLLKSTSKANIICIILLLASNVLPYGLSKYLVYFQPYYYISKYANDSFSNLKGLKSITFYGENNISSIMNFMCILLYIGICVTIQIIIDKKREYV